MHHETALVLIVRHLNKAWTMLFIWSKIYATIVIKKMIISLGQKEKEKLCVKNNMHFNDS